MKNSICSILLLAALPAGAPVQAAPTYSVEDLGVLSGDTESAAAAINASGQAVGRSKPAAGFFRAVLWNTGTPTDLATVIGQQTSVSNGINDAGHLTALAGFVDPMASTGTTAHFWNGTTLTNLGKIGTGTPQGFPGSIGNDVNNVDQVVGRAWASSQDTGEYHAFSWQGGALTDLGTLAGCNETDAADVNNNGQIVGTASLGCLPSQAVVWSSASAAAVSINSVLATAGIPDNITRATGINDSGSVLTQRVTGGTGRCVIFNPTPTVTDVGFIGASGNLETCAPGRINNVGEVVATQTGTPDDVALLYSGGVLYDLNAVLDAPSAATWVLLSASDINDSGTIVGQGRINGELHAFRATRIAAGSVTVSDSVGAIDDQSLPFGAVTIGVGTIGTVTVTNDTASPVAIQIPESLATPFGIADPQDCTVSLGADEACTITITYDPTTTATSNDSFTLDLGGTPALVTVSGTGRVGTASVTDSVSPTDDLTVPFTNSVLVGGSGTATVTVRNTDLTAFNVALTDGLAAPFSFQNPAACNATLTPNQACVLTIVFSPVVAGAISETFTLNAGGATSVVTVTGAPGVPNADLRVAMTADNLVVQPGASGSDLTTFTLAVTNDGPDSAGAAVTDVLPSGLSFVTATAGQGNYDPGTGIWNVGALASGAQTTLQIQAQATPGASGCISNAATVAALAPAVDPVGGNNSASLYIAAPSCADLEFGAIAVNDMLVGNVLTPIEGVDITQTVEVRNRGPGPATNVRLTVVSYVLTPPNTTATTPAANTTIALGNLAVGETKEVAIATFTLENRNDTDVNYTVSVAGAEADPDTGDNAASGGYTISATERRGGCFIATAAYGSYLDPDVLVLRRFRDRVLMESGPGRAFIAWYYRVSPPVADYIQDRDALRSLTRVALTPVVYGIKYPGPAGLIVASLGLLPIMRRRPLSGA